MNPHQLLNEQSQIKSVESLKRVDDVGRLYYMENSCNYYNLTGPLTTLLNAGCSTFVAKNTEGEWLMYRNYDYLHYLHNDKTTEPIGLNVICKNENPAAKYKSISVGDAFWLDFKNGTYGQGCVDDGKTDISPFIIMPYVCMDGVNEQGLAVSIMALVVKADWKEIDYNTYQNQIDPNKTNYHLEKAGEVPDIWAKKCDIGSIAYNDIDKKAWICEKEFVHTNYPGKKTVLHPVLMRMILDNCSSVDEAIAFAKNFNVAAPAPGMDFHILIADKSGNCKVLEWIGDQLNIIDTYHSTNYRFSQDDYFHGFCPRDEAIKAGLAVGKQHGLRQDYGELAMRLATQDPTTSTEKDIGKTQYSAIYNLNKQTLKIYSFANFDKSWNYKL